MEGIDSTYSKGKDVVTNFAKEGSIAAQIFSGIGIVILLYIVFSLIFFVWQKILTMFVSTPLILDGLQSASTGIKVSQDPRRGHSKLMKRSSNEINGVEFSYAMWMKIDNWENQEIKWKHVLHKGVEFERPSNNLIEPHKFCEIQAPGIWIHPDTNTIRVYMNTFDSVSEYIDIKNVPINKWFHFGIIFSHRHLDIYFNGYLKKRLKLKSVPKQNYYDVHVSKYGGFQGNYSNIQYFNYAISPSGLQYIVKSGPSFRSVRSTDLNSEIPYLSNRWWTKQD